MSATVMIFVLACVAHPEWLAKAQMELDKVVGSERLPEFRDLKDLPYIQRRSRRGFPLALSTTVTIRRRDLGTKVP